MPKPEPSKYILLSVPTSVSPSNSTDEALTTLRSGVTNDNGTVFPFPIPELKVGTLDTLVRQADELQKIHNTCEGVVSKVGDTLRVILEGDESKLAGQKTVNDKEVGQYLKSWSWNKIKYRADKPLAELIEIISKEVSSIDNDVKGKYTQYNQVKTTLANLEKRQSGNLSTKSLTSIISPSQVIQDSDSEYLVTHLIAVPLSNTKDFLKTYERIAPWIVPRSAQNLASDDEYILFAVTGFKKYANDWLHKVREQRWVPRDYKTTSGGGKDGKGGAKSAEDERKELESVRKEERKLWGETLRIAHTGWGEAVMGWIHILALQVFVESVLRYGLPLDFVAGLVKTTPKLSKKARASLDTKFSYLAGNALGRDKKGRPTKDSGADMQAAGQMGEGSDYTAYVCYEFEIN
ncbi:Vacuolar ATP synthase subunit C [Agyrium rufum]|nr:Vacuolar ATP synthase subunit C [Agyrium rufum]